MKVLLIAAGFLGGIWFTYHHPEMAKQIMNYMENSSFMVGLLR